MHPSILFLALFATFSVGYMGDIVKHHPRTKSVNVCHWPAHDHDPVVGISKDMMALQKGDNPSSNKRCGSLITIWNPQTRESFEAEIVDICDDCDLYDLAVSPSLYAKVAPYAHEHNVASGIAWGGDEVGG